MAEEKARTTSEGLRHVDTEGGVRVALIETDDEPTIWIGLVDSELEEDSDFFDAGETLSVANTQSKVDSLIRALEIAREWLPE